MPMLRTVLIWAWIAVPFRLPAESNGSCAAPFEASAPVGHEIAMSVRSGDITIEGTDAPVLRVSCRLNDPDRAGEVRISFAANHLTVRGGPENGNLRIRIEVPRKTNLYVRTPAGNLTVSGIEGDKDVELRAGNLTIETAASEYRRAHAFVLAGNLTLTAFGVEKDGLFRSFSRENAEGRYRLHAEVLAGNLVLK
jgi:hypothetical protein